MINKIKAEIDRLLQWDEELETTIHVNTIGHLAKVLEWAKELKEKLKIEMGKVYIDTSEDGYSKIIDEIFDGEKDYYTKEEFEKRHNLNGQSPTEQSSSPFSAPADTHDTKEVNNS